MQIKAVIVGALGVIGRYIVEKFIEEPDWTVVGLSRRKATNSQRYRHIAVDLLDPEDTKRKLAELTDVTHVFYAAFQAAPGSAANFASNAGPNREMLVNSVTAIDRAADTIYQVTESTHFASAALWAATDQRCGNEAFNITNGDYFRWRNLWPKIAAVFEMAVAEPQTICLTQHMADKAALWEEMTARYKLMVGTRFARKAQRQTEFS
jgi:nucleoside-diphosphate-sugar epimerase